MKIKQAQNVLNVENRASFVRWIISTAGEEVEKSIESEVAKDFYTLLRTKTNANIEKTRKRTLCSVE